MALPQLHPEFPATLCRNRSRPVNTVCAEEAVLEEPHRMEQIAAQAAVDPVNLINVMPSRTVAEQDAELGPRLFGRNPDLCCFLRKVEPLERTLKNYDAWISGVRRVETLSRRATRVVEFDEKRQMVKVNPIVAWTSEQVDDYIAANGVLVNPLVYDGYPSIGCRTCTMRVEPGADARSGRWAGTGKTECGLHA